MINGSWWIIQVVCKLENYLTCSWSFTCRRLIKSTSSRSHGENTGDAPVPTLSKVKILKSTDMVLLTSTSVDFSAERLFLSVYWAGGGSLKMESNFVADDILWNFSSTVFSSSSTKGDTIPSSSIRLSNGGGIGGSLSLRLGRTDLVNGPPGDSLTKGLMFSWGCREANKGTDIYVCNSSCVLSAIFTPQALWLPNIRKQDRTSISIVELVLTSISDPAEGTRGHQVSRRLFYTSKQMKVSKHLNCQSKENVIAPWQCNSWGRPNFWRSKNFWRSHVGSPNFWRKVELGK